MGHEMVQVWEPFLPCSLFEPEHNRDYLRAQDAWRGEDRVWILTRSQLHASRSFRWHIQHRSGVRISECLIQGEQLNAYDLYHVDEQRRIYPVLRAPNPEQTWKTLPEGLYRLWLNTYPQRRPPSSHFLWEVPRVSGGQVEMATLRVKTSPGAVAPLVVLDEGTSQRVTIGWTSPEWNGPPPISPQAENATR